MKYKNKEFCYSQFCNLQSCNRNSGQSLVEILIGLAIGSLLIGASSIAIIGILRSSTSSRNYQASSSFNQETLDRVRSFSNSNWNDLNSLSKGSGTNYFLNASGSTFSIITGKEGIIDNDVLSGLVAHWGFDEATSTTATSTYDGSGNNNTGIMSLNVLRATSTCKISFCFSFNGADTTVSVSTSTTVNVTSAITLAVWVRTSATNDASGIVYKVASNSGYKMSFDVSGGVRADFYNDASAISPIYSATNVEDNNWHFVVATYDGSTAKIYVDGVVGGTAPTGSGYVTGTNNTNTSLVIGNDSSAVNRYYNGLLDDVRVYNRALTSNEIQRIYESSRFARYFAIENICRTNNSSNAINSTAPCTGSDVNDPLTQQVTVYTEWTPPGGSVYNANVVDYIVRSKNFVFHQTDWSGGTGQGGPITDINNKFASSSKISTSTGSFRIQGL